VLRRSWSGERVVLLPALLAFGAVITIAVAPREGEATRTRRDPGTPRARTPASLATPGSLRHRMPQRQQTSPRRPMQVPTRARRTRPARPDAGPDGGTVPDPLAQELAVLRDGGELDLDASTHLSVTAGQDGSRTVVLTEGRRETLRIEKTDPFHQVWTTDADLDGRPDTRVPTRRRRTRSPRRSSWTSTSTGSRTAGP